VGGSLASAVRSLTGLVRERLDRQEFHMALETILASVRDANGYITQEAPWALKKTDPVRMAAVLRVLHDALRTYATLLQPFMPGTMAALLDQLGVPAGARDLAALATPLTEGTALPAPSPLFRKIELPA
jgi:methionyl-tRNA synthetase